MATCSRKRLKARKKEEFNADQEYLPKNFPCFTVIFFYAGVLRDLIALGCVWSCSGVDRQTFGE
jgi:hypothetical protein